MKKVILALVLVSSGWLPFTGTSSIFWNGSMRTSVVLKGYGMTHKVGL
jgi:hypothetical protein